MKILSIDTASNICGVSILDNTKLICKLDTITGRTHSENLIPMIDSAFKKTSLSLNDIDLLACDIGPGSFTGIRIGVATTKAFHDSLNIPYIGVSSLEALAYNLKDILTENEFVCSILDCKNDNCYFALYTKKENNFEVLIEPQAETINSALSILQVYIQDNFENGYIHFVGDGSETFSEKILKAFKTAKFATKNLNSLSSYNLGLAGLNNYNLEMDQQELLPLYLRKPQAQRQLEEKEGK